MTRAQESEINKIIGEFNSLSEMEQKFGAVTFIKTAFESGLKLAKEPKKKRFKRPAVYPEGCLCEICFAPVHDTAKKL